MIFLRKILALLVIILIVNNLIALNVFASSSVNITGFTLKVNGGSAYNGDIEANPGDNISILLDGNNFGTEVTDLRAEFDFSSNDFSYINQNTIDSYVNFVPEKSNIDTNTFNPPIKNQAPIADTFGTSFFFGLYYLDINIDSDFGGESLTIGAKTISNEGNSNRLTRNIFLNTKPHITDYKFTKNGSVVTSIKRGGENIDFELTVKDYNSCSNIDSGIVTADLSEFGLSSSESLNFVSCNNNEAIFKKTGISTILLPKSFTLNQNSFSVTDESGNTNTPNDGSRSFYNEDKKTDLNFEITSAGVPSVTYSISDDYIGGSLNNNSDLNFSSDQNGEYKVIVGSSIDCSAGTTLTDWTSGYVAGTEIQNNINSSSLGDGDNSIYVCFKNDEGKIGSTNFNITKDTVGPTLSAFSYGPVSIVDQDLSLNFTCSEDGFFQVEKGGTDTPNSGAFIGSGSVVNNNDTAYSVLNSNIDVLNNEFRIFCYDNAKNYTSNIFSTTKTTKPPSFSSVMPTLEDIDLDFDGLDGRDIKSTWNTTIGTTYQFFDSWRVFILPENVTLNTEIHNALGIISDVNNGTFTGSITNLKDSVGNTLVSGNSYKSCISIIGSNGYYGETGCSNGVNLIGDVVSHAEVESVKFTNDTTLEITTNTTLDTNLVSHSGSLISYNIGGSSYNGLNIISVDGKKINIGINSLGGTDISGTNLIVGTGAIRASIGGYNNLLNVGNISDGVKPEVTGLSLDTTSTYNNFYNGNLEFSYNLSENITSSFSKIEFIRKNGNLDSNTYQALLLGNELTKGSSVKNINIDDLNLVNGTEYTFRIVGRDSGGNQFNTDYVGGFKYDKNGPEKVISSDKNLFSSLTPELTWTASMDDNGNGSGIKEYKINVYSGNDCNVGSLFQSGTSTNTNFTTNTLVNISDNSWNIQAFDNMGNESEVSDCKNFRVDTTVPNFSGFKVTDKVINSDLYLVSGNSIEVTSTITGTDIDHIWLDISVLTGNSSDNNILCSTPTSGITCVYLNDIVKVNFTAGTLVDGIKQITIKSQNTSGGNESTQVLSTTSDSNSPNVDLLTLISPIGIVGGNSLDIKWDNTKINDTVGIKEIVIEYKKGPDAWTNVGTINNTGVFTWDITSFLSGNDYFIRFKVSDNGNNETIKEFPVFELDKTIPSISTATITQPNGTENIKGNSIYEIKWDKNTITDDNLLTNPITLYYSIDSGTNWINIVSGLENSGTYNWNIGNLNTSNGLIKIVAEDMVGNVSEDISDGNFVIDSIKPSLIVNFSATPSNNSFINNSGIDISLNTSDINSDKVLYKFVNTTTGNNFDGSSFTSSGSWVEICSDTTVNGTNNNCDNISFSISPTIISNNNYTLEFKSIDEAGNEEKSVLLNYIGDIDNPVVSINNTTGEFFKDSINITGSSSDVISGISSVKLQIKKDGKYWNGSEFISGEYNLSTTTSNNYSDWNYIFTYGGDEGNIDIIATAFDNSFKVNNSSNTNIGIIKDTTVPVIGGGVNLFTSPILGDIYIGGNNIDISWNNNGISDTDSGLAVNPIGLEYFDGTTWNLIVSDIENNGNYAWNNIPNLDYNNVKIKLSAKDIVGNISYQNSNGFIVDSTSPTVSTIETMDLDTDGQIDALNLIFSENILDSTINLSDFYIGSGIGNPTSWETGNIADDNQVVIKFSSILNTSVRPSLDYTSGSLTDIAGKKLSSFSGKNSLDKATPRILWSKIFDQDGNGKLDKIEIEFSENIQQSTDFSNITLNNLYNGISINNISVSSNKAILILNEGIDFNTSNGNISLDFTNSNSWIDYSANQVGSITNLALIDSAKVIIYSAEYKDENSNSKVDKVNLYLTEEITGFSGNEFNISGVNKGNGNYNNKIISFDIAETSSDNDTGVVSNFDYSGASINDLSGNTLDVISGFNVSDKVAPKLIGLSTNDSDNNGKIDNIILNYSEELNSDLVNTIFEVDGYNISGSTKIGNNDIKISLNENELYDSNIEPLIKIISNSTLKDLNGNLVNTFGYTKATDKIGPVIIGARYNSGLGSVILDFSEDITGSDFKTGNIVLENAGSYNVNSVNFGTKTIYLSNETVDYGTTKISFKGNLVSDLKGNKQSVESYVNISAPIVINEIMLSNDSNDNYIELKNNSSSSIDISNYTVAGVTIPSGKTIIGNGYFLITKSDKNSSVMNIDSDLIDNNLDLSGNSISLNNGIIDIDNASLITGKNDLTTPKSIERKNNTTNGISGLSWYTAQDSVGFDNATAKGTPGSINVLDSISPSIDSYFPTDDLLLSGGNLNIIYNYSDEGLGVNNLNSSLTIRKWNGSSWISQSNSFIKESLVTTTSADFKVQGLSYGKYKSDFYIYDVVGNLTIKSVIFYVDEFTLNIDRNTIDLGKLKSGLTNFTEEEVTITVETIGAGFSLDLAKNGLLSNGASDIIDWNGTYGYGIDKYDNGYSENINLIGNSVNLDNKTGEINLDGNKNTYVYKFKLGSKIPVIQEAGNYKVDNFINVSIKY